ncbi:MAG TPA: 50S ribosomal protein L11 methyltransferase [Gaiellaceae bacterium]|nr:50S ribosomal protein L11 methyltransferase [Gaiellaceae bacterium]
MLALFPEGFEEADRGDEFELSAYTDERGEARMAAVFGAVAAREVPADWAERWKHFHRPVRAGRIWIVPPWEQAPHDEESITIDPGRAFGTGTHPTTRLCLELVSELEPCSLVDVGCGSGVLAIAAVKLGFAPVMGLDSDPHAIAAAEANASANGVELELRLADARVDPLPRADVAVANISEELVGAVGARLDCSLLVTSGYFEPHVPSLPGFHRLARRRFDGWAADLHGRE